MRLTDFARNDWLNHLERLQRLCEDRSSRGLGTLIFACKVDSSKAIGLFTNRMHALGLQQEKEHCQDAIKALFAKSSFIATALGLLAKLAWLKLPSNIDLPFLEDGEGIEQGESSAGKDIQEVQLSVLSF